MVVVPRFDVPFADQSAEQFLERVTRGRQLAALVLTAESAFGRDREGGLPAIRRLAHEYGYRVIEVTRLAKRGEVVSSTVLRKVVEQGRLSEVRRLLGRRYAVAGT